MTTIDVLVDIPPLSLLADGSIMAGISGERVAVQAERLAYPPDAAGMDIWNLPAAAPALVGTLALDGPTPRARCSLPLPAPGEVALYRVAILKAGTVLDEAGQRRDEQLHPTEEELLLFLVHAEDGQMPPLIPGTQCVVVSARQTY